MKRKRTFSMDLSDTSMLVERNKKPNGYELVNSFRVGRHDPTDLVELAREIQLADNTVRSTACGKLQVIAEQVRFLQQQAQRVLQEARDDQSRHHAHCNFKRVPGHVYHLYRKRTGEEYWSMLSPSEWGGSAPPQEYLGSFRLEHDMSWTPADRLEQRSHELAQLTSLLDGRDNVNRALMMDTSAP
ncbi:hypothetical protein KUF71_015716 [Frankliniella fusca]|uniref:DUF2452 domain-containing protein n=1 Tax=Frankliniella fusca TaxID=407009 RepID=A0AAE1HTZ2_9NEOP|nr:hypothetical protein KUF71_015716 [Frankliniella fusca]